MGKRDKVARLSRLFIGTSENTEENPFKTVSPTIPESKKSSEVDRLYVSPVLAENDVPIWTNPRTSPNWTTKSLSRSNSVRESKSAAQDNPFRSLQRRTSAGSGRISMPISPRMTSSAASGRKFVLPSPSYSIVAEDWFTHIGERVSDAQISHIVELAGRSSSEKRVYLKLLSQTLITQDLCPRCQLPDSLVHWFFECQTTQVFLHDLYLLMSNYLDQEIDPISLKDLIFFFPNLRIKLDAGTDLLKLTEMHSCAIETIFTSRFYPSLTDKFLLKSFNSRLSAKLAASNPLFDIPELEPANSNRSSSHASSKISDEVFFNDEVLADLVSLYDSVL